MQNDERALVKHHSLISKTKPNVCEIVESLLPEMHSRSIKNHKVIGLLDDCLVKRIGADVGEQYESLEAPE